MWFSKSAAQGNMDAAAYAGYMIYNGIAGAADKQAGLGLLKNASDAGVTFGMSRYAATNIQNAVASGEDGPDPLVDVALLKSAASKGDAYAQSVLGGIVYFYGYAGIDPDLEASTNYLKLAAAQNEPFAMELLGQQYLLGSGVSKDEQEGWRLIKASADAGFARGQYNVGIAMLQGSNGIPQNNALGLAYMTKAAEGGDPAGMAVYADILDRGELVPRDIAGAVKYAQLAADAGDSGAMVLLAYFFYAGDGVEKNPIQSFNWAKRAAFLDNPTGMRMLGALYAEGLGVAQNKETATLWFVKAAGLGDQDSIDRLEQPEFAAIKASLAKQGLVEN
jgi:TPR repeat protein